ncbi:MAG TPA: hypothetical protein VFS02_02985 [Telluria sp.]|nr:hypothetical protein [Telluria sp.]
MRTPTSSELLSVWEIGGECGPARRSLALLALALPDIGETALARYSIGARDDLLLALRERLFGDELASIAHCPACATLVETRWRATALRASIAATPAAPGESLELDAHQHHIRYRLPTSADILAVGDCRDPAAARRILLRRCVLAASDHGAPVTPDDLSAEAVAVLEASMASADPMADIDCALQCPACGHRWSVGFDIARFLWSELHGWAQRLLVDVHTLARAYGWREADILAMSPGRRSLYVEMSAS